MTEQVLVDANVGLGFQRYIQSVAEGVGAGIEQWCCRGEHPMEAYIALDREVPRFPGREVALLWEETCGWALAVETRSGEDLIVLGYLGDDAVPAPDAVAAFGASVGTPDARMRRRASWTNDRPLADSDRTARLLRQYGHDAR
ncbi:hypothetical protein FFI94_022805 [Rhodococcus sp. KBS0724]|jgi:hypothetical protein|uniref:DUF6292 family protein n=1 Tax=Rhodococcus sp. KBS0724 TaxID=1179674 RepID=UPI00110DBB34|nr:DUF6292 family protein [Rhodococcus sp. KBS0724]TSD48692.1 hypothetical protein FFI94_022805 [Rhodococcus sp. KBS0724]